MEEGAVISSKDTDLVEAIVDTSFSPLRCDDLRVVCSTPVSRRSTSGRKSNTTSEDFAKGLQISKDGSQVLVAYENRRLEVFSIDDAFLDRSKYYRSESSMDAVASVDVNACETQRPPVTPTKQILPGESVYDFAWYPFTNSADLSSQCFITTCRDKPVQLFGVQDGLRCSYCTVNAVSNAAIFCSVHTLIYTTPALILPTSFLAQLDELEPATCVGFNLTGDKIYCGSTRLITSFDTGNPGRCGTSSATSKTRRDPVGQRGVMSCLVFNPDRSGTFAVGSYANSVGIYTENDMECVLEIRDMEFGVSHVKWSPCGNFLWAGGRRSDFISCWDGMALF